jgi:hypothetical protein
MKLTIGNHPSIAFLCIFIHLLSSICGQSLQSTASPCYWKGGSGYWNNPENWNPASLPNSACTVIIGNLSEEDVLSIPSTVYTINDLIITNTSLGTVYIMQNTTLNIINSFVMNGNVLLGSSSNSSIINVSNFTRFHENGKSSRRLIRTISIYQRDGRMLLRDVELVLNDAALYVDSNAMLLMQPSATKTIHLKNDVSRLNYDRYDESSFTNLVNLQYAVPAENAVYDLIASSVLRLNASLAHSMIESNSYTWPHAIQTDLQAQIYYAYHVGHWLPGEHKSALYNRSIPAVDPDECAMICNLYPWCKSFDYYTPSHLCMLSAYYSKHVGGLLSNSSWTHFSQRVVVRDGESKFVVKGEITVVDGSYSQVFIGVDTDIFGVLHLNESLISFSRSLNIYGTVSFHGHSYLSMNSSISSLYLYPSGLIISSNEVVSCSISFSGGDHTMSGLITGQLSVRLVNGATLAWTMTSESSNHYSTVSLVNNSLISFTSRLEIPIYISKLELSSSSRVNGNTLNITSNFTAIDASSVISVSGNLQNSSCGISPGLAHNFSPSGGTHGGLGGNGNVDVSGPAYDSATYPILPGSDGGVCLLSSSSSRAGQGGGVLHLLSTALVLDGVIESDGNSGGSSCTGGGAGGSIIIRSNHFSGNGKLSARGGDGGFAGGSASGGAGGGGRIAVYADTLSFIGSFDVSGGYRPRTAKADNENAGSGSFYVNACIVGGSSACVDVQALVVADTSTKSYWPFLRNRQSNQTRSSEVSPKRTLLYHETTPRRKGSYVIDSSSQFSTAVPLDVHIIGSSPIVFRGQLIEVGNIVGSESAVVIFENGIFVSANQNNVTLEDCTIYVANATFASNIDYVVGKNAQLVLYNNHEFQFKSVRLRDYGSLITLNQTMPLSGERLIFASSGGMLALSASADLSVASIEIYEGLFTCASASATDQDPSLHINISTGTLMTVHGAMYLDSSLTLDIHGQLIFGNANVEQLSYGSSGSILLGESDDNSRQAVILISSESNMTVADNSTTYIYSDLIIDGNIYIDSLAILNLRRGSTTCVSNHTISTQTGSSFVIDQSASVNTQACPEAFLGDGQVIVQRRGALYPANLLPSQLTDIHVRNEGIISFENISHYDVYTDLYIDAEGILNLQSNTTVSIHQNLFFLSGVLKFGAPTSFLNISGHIYLSNGLIYGPGYLTLKENGILVSTNSSSIVDTYVGEDPSYETELLYSQLTILQTSIINRGSMSFTNNIVNFARGLRFHNLGSILLHDCRWNNQQRLFAYRLYQSYDPVYSYLGLEVNPTGHLYENVTQVSCAALCQNQHKLYSHQLVSTQKFVDEPYACVGFFYQQKTSICQLRFTRSATDVSNLAPIELADFESPANVSIDYLWDFFAIDAAWAKDSKVVNYVSGTIAITSNSYLNTISIPFENDGLLLIPASSTMTVSDRFVHNAIGNILLNGTLAFTGSSLATGAVDEAISSYVYFLDGDVSSMSNHSSVISGPIGGNGNLIFAGRLHYLTTPTLHSPDIHITVSGQVQLVNVSFMDVYDLYIELSGEVFVYNQPLEFKANSLIVSGDLRSHDHVIRSWPASSTIGFNCSECYDISIKSTILNITATGTVSLAHGIITTPVLVVDGSIASNSRGFSSSEIFSIAYQVSSALNISAWAGFYGLLGSSGGSHGGARGGLGYGYQYDITSGLFNDKSSQSVSFHDYPHQQVQYKRRMDIEASSYDAYFSFLSWGTPGGEWKSVPGGQGGGTLRIYSSDITINGKLSCDGQSISESLAGGGSGGSLLVVAQSLRGVGTISASGGLGGFEVNNPSIQGGGGSGGRVIIVVNDTNFFTGTIVAHGGDGFEAGSPGTVAYFDNVEGFGSSLLLLSMDQAASSPPRLVIDGQASISAISSFITPSDLALGLINSIQVLNSVVRVSLFGDQLLINDFLSDGTGAVYISDSTIVAYRNTSLTLQSIAVYVENDAQVLLVHLLLRDSSILSIFESGSMSATMQGISSGRYSLTSISITSNSSMVVAYLQSFDSKIRINVADIYISADSALSSDGQGYRSPTSSVQGGGGHGGKGGQSMTGLGETEYGNVTFPNTFGRAGGSTIHNSAGSGAGGGIIHLTATRLSLQGKISANGNDAYIPGASGGSGGSIYISTTYFEGSGSIEANGGDGLYSKAYFGAGGSGGRIAIFCSSCTDDDETAVWSNLVSKHQVLLQPSFLGSVLAQGGHSNYQNDDDPQVRALEVGEGYALDEWLEMSPYAASSGTIYFSLNSSNSLLLDNAKTLSYNESYDYVNLDGVYSISSKKYQLTPSPLSLTSYPSLLQFDRLYLSRYARLAIDNGLKLNITQYVDDGTGEILIQSDGLLYLPSQYSLSLGNITLYGSLVGAKEMTLKNASAMTLYPSAVWSDVLSSNVPAGAGLVNISDLTLQETSIMTIAGGSQYDSYSKLTIYCRRMSIVDSTSILTASGHGYTAQGLGGASLQPGQTTSLYQGNSNVSYADGGWHAGRGGGRLNKAASSGNAYQPSDWGRAGGSTYVDIGTSGGGSVQVVATNSIINNGIISSNGNDCSNAESTAGTGAGGSVWLQILNGSLTGTGIIEANGGDGCLSGGGSGSGGRISVWDTTRGSAYSGSYSARSGLQAASTILTFPPSGGTVFKAYTNGSLGILTATNHGQGGSTISIYGSDTPSSNYSLIDNLDCIYLYDANMTLAAQSVILAERVISLDLSVVNLSSISSFPLSSDCFTSAIGRLIVDNQAVLVLGNSSHSIVERDMVFLSSALLYRGNMTFSSTLVVSPTTSCSRRISNDEYTDISNSPRNISSLLSNLCPVMVNKLFSSSVSSQIFNEFSYDNLKIASGASLRFSAVTDQNYLPSSFMITASAIEVERGGSIDASDVLQIVDTSLGLSAASTTGASGGGHAGYGEKGYGSTTTSSYRGNISLPFGFGQGGGRGQASGEDGGNGGMGLLVHASKLIVDGLITVNGGTPQMGTGAGGGAGGSLIIATSSLQGNGTLSADGGHGSISSQSLVHGGSGSAGRVSLFYCNRGETSSFSGNVHARGGLTLTSTSSFSNLYDSTWRSFRSMQQLSAAAAGTIVLYNLSDSNACDSFVQSSTPNLQSLTTISSDPTLEISSWSNAYLNDLILKLIAYPSPVICNASVDLLALDAAIASLEISSLTNSSLSVSTSPTILALESDISFSSLSLVNASLELHSSGSLIVPSLTSQPASSLLFYDNTSFSVGDTNSSEFMMSDVSMWFYDCSRFGYNSFLDLILMSNSTLYFFNEQNCRPMTDRVIISTANDSVLSSKSSHQYIELNQSYSLHVNDLTLRDNSHIHGSAIAIRANSLSIEDSSSINADRSGYFGGAVVNSKPTDGYGPGKGGAEEVGGNGGAYGGDGGMGITALSRLSLYDYSYRNTGNSASTIDLSFLLSTNQLGYSYGDFRYPLWSGSGGGAIPGMSSRSRGGRGGGIVVLKINDINIDADCRISADGESLFDGGGAGAGGSIYLTHSTGLVTGSGRISTVGGSTCAPTSNCSISIQYPGGFGAGGRIRMDRDMSFYAGSISAISGASSQSSDGMLNLYHGSIISQAATLTMRKSTTSLDLIFPDPTRRIIQVISTSGYGDGDRSNTDSFHAIVKGSWELGYRSNHASSLSSQVTAIEVQQLLESFTGISHVNVARRENLMNGWDWIITFFDSLQTSELLSVTGKDLYTSSQSTLNNTASIMVSMIHWSSDAYASYANLTTNSSPDSNNAFSRYSSNEIASFVGFNLNITDSSSFAYWIDLSRYRIMTNSSSLNDTSLLRLTYLGPVPTSQGWLSSLNTAAITISD